MGAREAVHLRLLTSLTAAAQIVVDGIPSESDDVNALRTIANEMNWFLRGTDNRFVIKDIRQRPTTGAVQNVHCQRRLQKTPPAPYGNGRRRLAPEGRGPEGPPADLSIHCCEKLTGIGQRQRGWNMEIQALRQ